jgi:hypothetical protein
MGEKMRELIAQGMAPEELAERVVEAVESGQFWILTHPEMDFRISDRSERILARRNPEHLETQPKEIGE